MSAAAKDKATEQQWLEDQASAAQDHHDIETAQGELPPVGKVLATCAVVAGLGVAALLLMGAAGGVGWALTELANKVFP